ncbi:hypothetical protein [Clostridium tyrobutyricum]|uniref:hypothetical protein n=1 Tax=Clostridium tyrobutyricum TaxID=1519 RepID=UPI0011CCDB6C|nr:hypothetical protein [Clostridium tyrobutyricum]
MKTSFDKGQYLKKKFNEYWSLILKDKQDYFSKMTEENFDLLKSALSNINNIITYNTTIKFVDTACKILNISSEEKEQISNTVKSTKPSDNGFDVEYRGSINFVCEVKCNRPINGGDRFGSAQKSGIEKDLIALLNGKTKSPINIEEIRGYYKFMVIYKFDSNTVKAINHYLLHLPKQLVGKVKLYEDGMEICKDLVYVLLIK